MVNPYVNRTANQRDGPKPQVLLGQSNALKKFEKFQSKYDPNVTSVQRKNIKKQEILEKKKHRHVLDSTDEEDKIDSDDDDDESFFKGANKFMKKKQPASPPPKPASEDSDEDKSDIEISIVDRSSTPKRVPQKPGIMNRSANSSATSIRSMTGTHRRSISKVKFVNETSEDDEEDSTNIEDMLSKNFILDINDLENQTSSHSIKFSARNIRGKTKPAKIGHHKRSESVTSIQEESILQSSVNDAPSETSLMETNLIMDINELEKSISKMEKKEKKLKKKHRDRYDSESTSKNKKKNRTTTDSITTFLEQTDSSIATESIPDIDGDEDIHTVNSEITVRSKNKSHRTTTNTAKNRSYFTDDFETFDKTTHTTHHQKKGSRSPRTPRTPRTQRSYYDGFDTTDFDVDATPRNRSEIHKKQLSFFDTTNYEPQQKFKPVSSANAGCQVDPTDLLKNSQLLNTVNVYNPSSILLATTSHLNSQQTLNDLNQMTGYTMINQAFNDILKVNVNFVKNFLGAQRSLYEQQINSIRPTRTDY